MGKTSLAPGFRFHPTDVELVRYYLKRKVLGKKFMTDAIAEIDIYQFEPPDLPDKSCLKTGDLKWYFFCPRGKKYPKSAKANRSTESGFWKTSGKDRDVSYNNEVVGRIRTLIFHYGKSPRGDRTDWVMHEYRLEDKALKLKNVPQDTYVLCKLFKKDGLGPRHGTQYGAPFKDEDWSDDNDQNNDTENLAPMPCAENIVPVSPSHLVAMASNSQAPEDCLAGGISESCVSDVPPQPLTATVIPPLTNDVVAYTPLTSSPMPLLEAPQAPPADDDDDDLYSMLDLFVVNNDESLLFDGFNYQNEIMHEPPGVEEDPVRLGDGDLNGIPELTDELFLELQDLLEPSTPLPPPDQAGSHGDSRSNGQT